MEPDYPTNLPGRRRSRKWLVPLAIAAIIFGAGLGYYLTEFIPTSRHEPPTFNGNNKPVFHNGVMLDKPATGKEESLKLPFATVQELLDPTMIYEEASESTIITTQDKVIRLRTSQLTGMINEKPFTLKFPLEKANGSLYLPMEPLRQLYSFELRESAETGAVILVKEGDTIEWAKTVAYPDKPARTIPMRSGPTIKSPIIISDAAILFRINRSDRVRPIGNSPPRQLV